MSDLIERSKAIEAVRSVAPGTTCRGQAIIAAICALPDANATDEIAALRSALANLTNRYCRLADSGDEGFWEPREEREVIAAFAALAMGEGE